MDFERLNVDRKELQRRNRGRNRFPVLGDT